MASLRNIGVVAVFDFFESIRSRKAVALLLLYLTGSLGATGLFVRGVGIVEETLAETLSVAQTKKAGTMTALLFENEQFRRVVSRLIGDREVAASVLDIPPLALFYGALSLMLVPLLVVLTSSDAIAAEVSSGSSRFALFRTERLQWAVGKTLGQAALMVLGILAGAIGCYAIGVVFLTGFEFGATAWWLFRVSLRAAVFGSAYLGIALGVSLASKSVSWARALGVLGWFIAITLGRMLDSDDVLEKIPTLAPTLRSLVPAGHQLDLWRPDWIDRLPALILLPALATAYWALGYLRFARRDA